MQGLNGYGSSPESDPEDSSSNPTKTEPQSNRVSSSSPNLDTSTLPPVVNSHSNSPRTGALLNSAGSDVQFHSREETGGVSTPEEGEILPVESVGNGTPPSAASSGFTFSFKGASSSSFSVRGASSRKPPTLIRTAQGSSPPLSTEPLPHPTSSPVLSTTSSSLPIPHASHSKPGTPTRKLFSAALHGLLPTPIAVAPRKDSSSQSDNSRISPPPSSPKPKPTRLSPRKESRRSLDREELVPLEPVRSRGEEDKKLPLKPVRSREDGDRSPLDRVKHHKDDDRRRERARSRESEDRKMSSRPGTMNGDNERHGRKQRRTDFDGERERGDPRGEVGGDRSRSRDRHRDRSREYRPARRDDYYIPGPSRRGEESQERQECREREKRREREREREEIDRRYRDRDEKGYRRDRREDRDGRDGRWRYDDERGSYDSGGYRRHPDPDSRQTMRDELPYDDSFSIKPADHWRPQGARGGEAHSHQRRQVVERDDVHMRDRDISNERSRRHEESGLPKRPSSYAVLALPRPPPHQLPPARPPPAPRSPSRSPVRPNWSPVAKSVSRLPFPSAKKEKRSAGDAESSEPPRKRARAEDSSEPSPAPLPEPSAPLPPPPDMTPPPVPPGASPPLEVTLLPETAKEPPPPSVQIDLSNGVSVPPTPNPNLLKVDPISKPATPAPPKPASSLKASSSMKSVRAIGRHLDPQREEAVYGRTFTGVVKIDKYLRPQTTSDIKDATLGKGTFGLVTLATRISDDKRVALKLLQNPPSDDGKARPHQGILGSTLREIKLLKLLQHENIVPLLEIIVDRKQDGSSDTYLVFPYMDHDLCGLLKNKAFDNRPRILKLYMLQLLEGAAFMHHNNTVHRDLKSANLLIDNRGNLQIADFGLARPILSHPVDDRNDYLYTNMVVTRWYRAPELIMGESVYGAEVDIWSIGCIFGEMYSKNVLLNGNSDVDQLVKIFHLCGTPSPDYEKFHTTLIHNSIVNDNRKLDPREHVTVKEVASMEQRRRIHEFSSAHVTPEFVSLLDRILVVNPARRPTVVDLLNDKFFWLDPPPLAKEDVVPLNASKERRDQLEAEETAHAIAAANHLQQQQQQHQAVVAQTFAIHQHNQMAAAAAMQYAVAVPPMAYGNNMQPNGMQGMNGMNGMHQGNAMPMTMPSMGGNPYIGSGQPMRPNYVRQNQYTPQYQHQQQHQQQHQPQQQQSMSHQRPQFGPGMQPPRLGLPQRPPSAFPVGPPRGLNFAGAHGQGVRPPIGRPTRY